jgi:hypothetical protein
MSDGSATANELTRASAASGVDARAGIYAPDAIIWDNTDEVELTVPLSDDRARSGSPEFRGTHPRQTNDACTGTNDGAASAGNPQILAHLTHPRKSDGQDD